MARLAKVRSSKAEKYCHRTAVSAFILEEICPVLRAHLCPRYVATTAAYQFSRIERFPTQLCVATRFTTIISLLAFVTHIIRVSFHGVRSRILITTTGCEISFGSAKKQNNFSILIYHVDFMSSNIFKKILLV